MDVRRECCCRSSLFTMKPVNSVNSINSLGNLMLFKGFFNQHRKRSINRHKRMRYLGANVYAVYAVYSVYNVYVVYGFRGGLR